MSRYYRSYLAESTAPISYLLDTYSGASAAYSLRKLSSTYSGSAIRVRRSSDNAEQNIGFSGGDLDTTSLLSFVGANNGFITTWYDQGANGNNTIQTIANQQPQIVMSGVVNIVNSKPSIRFANSFQRFLYVNSTTVLNIQECLTTFSVVQFVSNNDNYPMIMSKGYGTDGAYSLGQYSVSTNKLNVVIESEFIQFASGVTSNGQQYLLSNTNATGTNGIKMYQNNTLYGQATTSNDLTGSNTYKFNIGRNERDLAYYIDGNIQEIICYPINQNVNLTNINTNVNNYYAIY
jgi:hypothetical protein